MMRLLWLLLAGRWPARCPDYDPSCDPNDIWRWRCKAPISPLCWDKRCRLHCGERCECEKADAKLTALPAVRR